MLTMSREHKQLKAAYRELFTELRDILYRHDPIGINQGAVSADDLAPIEQYDPEAETIIARHNEIHSASDLRRVIHQVFVSQFDLDPKSPEEWLDEVAVDVWPVWTRYAR